MRKAPLTVVGRPTFAIVGAGQAGAQAAFTLRERGFRGRIVLLGAEPHAPYMRPPLSKKLLAGALAPERVYLRPPAFYESHDIELKLGVSVQGIDAAASHLFLSNGLRLGYDRLLLATGMRPRRLEVPGSTGPGVHYLRTLQDSLELRAAAASGKRVAIVGGGYVGLEVAATLATAGARVRVLEIEERVLARVTTSGISGFFAEAHRKRGVDIRCATRVLAFEGTDRLEAIVTDTGRFEADLAVVGIGATPNVELALAAGIECDDGIVVDARCRTSVANIHAAGDNTSHPSALVGHRVRLESVQNACDQAEVAARDMLGEDVAYTQVPWFWSEQYEYKLQAAGLSEGHDEVVERGDREQGSFALLYRKAGRLVAVDAVNMPREYLAGRRDIATLAAPAANENAPGHVRTA
ncbi:MAG TPA: FAD-dependent oxidoreductase [Usitatibacter sp.]|nr:FAD-dependent oxidoreductase [Usitatibacter sp.]